MMKTLLSLLAFSSLCVGDFPEIDCQNPINTGCRAILGMTGEFASFPETKTQLTKFCNEKLRLVQCMDIYLFRCHTEEYLNELRQYVVSQWITLDKFCHENGTYRELLVKSGRCIYFYLSSSTPEPDEWFDIGITKENCEFYEEEQLFLIEGISSNCGYNVGMMIKELFQPALTFEQQLCNAPKVRVLP